MNKFLAVMAGLLLAGLPAAAQTQQPIRVNCGGANRTDSNGQVWQADTGFNVKLNSNLVLQNFDIFAAVGANAAVVEGFSTTVSNGINGLAGLDGTESSQCGLVLGAEFRTECGVDEALKFSQTDAKSPRHHARRLCRVRVLRRD